MAFAVRRTLAGRALAFTLAACQEQAAGPVTGTPVAAGTSFQGAMTLTRNAAGRRGDRVIIRTLVVEGERASRPYNRDEGRRAQGVPGPDGRFRLFGPEGTSVVIEGRIEGSRASGTFESRDCTYAMDLARIG
ncbi:hypothetical protein ACI6QG_05135 [Roseococcus sp. DSY-14]|uniref:hypothetical protein n=1 Tax=Roseococcus sp. DSY-14 TaxID=3369650 RepID=UPI00387B38C7